jgi:hypothetical protein
VFFRHFAVRLSLAVTTTSVVAVALVLATVLPAFSAAAPALQAPAGLSLLEVKMTGDEFIVLQNNTGTVITDLANYWVYVYNKVDPGLAGATSSGQQLPAGQLDAGQTLVLTSKARPNCGAQITWTLGPSLGDSAGFIQITKQATVAGAVALTPTDSVSWGTDTSTKPSTIGTIAKVPSSTADPAGMFYRTVAGWKPADIDGTVPCQLNVAADASTPAGTVSSSLVTATTQPPASIVSVASATTSTDPDAAPSVPAADAGLQAPQITELLPNPDGSGTDDTDEFIELYNPNQAPFHLVGFTLEAGNTIKHKYIFPDGTILPPQSFTAFYSADTGLSLSNTSGQADLLDPLGTQIAHTDAYGVAKDGQAWALADGVWYWTGQLTPNAANVVKQTTATSTGKAAKKTTAVKGASTTKSIANNGATGSASAASIPPAPSPIHPAILAAVATLAVGYGVYEYRHDLGNRLHQFRRNRALRRAAG